MRDYKPKVDVKVLDTYLGFSAGAKVRPNDCYAANFGYEPRVRKGGIIAGIEQITIDALRTVIITLKDGRTFNPCFLQAAHS